MNGIRARQAGFTMVELLLVMTMSLVLLTATLTIFQRAQHGTHENDKRTDTAELARNGLDKMARQLRNLAQRINNAQVIYATDTFDFVFQTSDPDRTWIRYCLDTSSLGAERGQLWMGQLAVANPGAAPAAIPGMSGACPGDGWTKTAVVADNVVNRINGVDRPVFSYSCIDQTTNCVTSGEWDQIINVNAQLAIDTSPNKAPAELVVATGVSLRNQNQEPTAEFENPPAVVAGKPRTLTFNASASADFEGRTLSYFWFKGSVPTEDQVRCDEPIATSSGSTDTLWGHTLIGEGVTLQHTFPSSDGSSALIGLVVCDPGDRFDITSATVTIP